MHQHNDVLRERAPRPAGAAELSGIRAELEQQRKFRTDQLEELAADAAEAITTGDEGRRQVTQVLTVAAEAAMAEIDAALQRLDDGSYGTCERCVEAIPVERLEVLPTSRLCTPCQYWLESGRSHNGRRARRIRESRAR